MTARDGLARLRELASARFQINRLRLLLVLMDALILNASVVLALVVRFDGSVTPEYWALWEQTAPWMTLVLVAVSFGLGLYNRIWEYASLEAAATIFMSVTGAFACVGLAVALLADVHYPFSVLVIAWAFTTLIIGGSRFGWRLLRAKLLSRGNLTGRKRRAVVYGSGRSAVRLAREAEQDPESPYEIVGLIDDDKSLRGMYAGGYRVLGHTGHLEDLARRYALEEIIIARDPGNETEQAVELVVKSGVALGLKVRTVPRFLEFVSGQESPARFRDIDVSDLIGRQPDCLDLDLPIDYVSERTVLVTGAGGSIGSEICRQLCRYNPGRIVLLGRGENRIHKIYYELKAAFPAVDFIPVICNITARNAMGEVFRRFHPQAVFHAAAHKHVFLMECNPVEAAWNNVVGTEIVADLARQNGVGRFVLISTDKATEPTSVMGATKALCERVVSRHNGHSATRFMAVRFGNVLGSAGSVVPIFQELARAGRPLTVTDPEADRYFMTIEEASFLVLQAGALGSGGETFVLDMGAPIKIVDIARRMLEMHGRDPSEQGEIEYIGLRPGEKLHESLVNPYEELIATSVQGVRAVQINGQTPSLLDVEEALGRLLAAIDSSDSAQVLATLTAATNAHLNGSACQTYRAQAPAGPGNAAT